jgi:hypothetical protein
MFNKVKTWLVSLPLLIVCGLASATSVLDTGTQAAVTSGFTDVKDTFLDVVTIAFPFLLGIIAIMLAPRIVKRIARMF